MPEARREPCPAPRRTGRPPTTQEGRGSPSGNRARHRRGAPPRSGGSRSRSDEPATTSPSISGAARRTPQHRRETAPKHGAEAAAFRADLRAGRCGRSARREGAGALRTASDLVVHGASPWVPKRRRGRSPWPNGRRRSRRGPRAAFFLAQAAAPALGEGLGASLVCLSDVAATDGLAEPRPARRGEGGRLDALVRNLAVALGPPMRVNGWHPVSSCHRLGSPPTSCSASSSERPFAAASPWKTSSRWPSPWRRTGR